MKYTDYKNLCVACGDNIDELETRLAAILQHEEPQISNVTIIKIPIALAEYIPFLEEMRYLTYRSKCYLKEARNAIPCRYPDLWTWMQEKSDYWQGEKIYDFVLWQLETNTDFLTSGFIFKRVENLAVTNVPYLISHHSTGFEWGYGGSGPHDLALNIAELICRHSGIYTPRCETHDGQCVAQAAFSVHHQMVVDLISAIPYQGCHLSYQQVTTILQCHLYKTYAT